MSLLQMLTARLRGSTRLTKAKQNKTKNRKKNLGKRVKGGHSCAGHPDGCYSEQFPWGFMTRAMGLLSKVLKLEKMRKTTSESHTEECSNLGPVQFESSGTQTRLEHLAS